MWFDDLTPLKISYSKQRTIPKWKKMKQTKHKITPKPTRLTAHSQLNSWNEWQILPKKRKKRTIQCNQNSRTKYSNHVIYLSLSLCLDAFVCVCVNVKKNDMVTEYFVEYQQQKRFALRFGLWEKSRGSLRMELNFFTLSLNSRAFSALKTITLFKANHSNRNSLSDPLLHTPC